MNLPDGFLDIVDEFSEARDEGLLNEVSCEEMYDNCPSETLVTITTKIKTLMKWVQTQQMERRYYKSYCECNQRMKD